MKIRKSYRIPLGFLVGAFYIWSAEPSIKSFITGLAVMVFGEFIRFLSAGTLIKFEGVTRNGIYAYTRNPLYLGSFFIGIGACIIGRNLIFFLLFIVLFPLVYSRVILREELYLKGRYGEDYQCYIQDVPRIFPRRFNLREVLNETAPFLAVKNREYFTVLGIIAIGFIIAAKMIFM